MHWGMVHVFWLLPLFWLIVMALLIWGAVRWFNSRGGHLHSYYPDMPHSDTPPTRLSALEILRQRYACGEIDEITFNQMRERLQGGEGPKYE